MPVPILEEAHWLWPLVLIPYSIEDAHTRTFTGREVVKDIKAAMSRVRVALSEDSLDITGRMTGRTHLSIPRGALVSIVPAQRRLVRIQFEEAEWSRLARAMTSGAPSGDRHCILLNVDRRDAWVNALNDSPGRS